MVYSELLFFLGVLPVSVLLSFLDRSTEYKNLILVLTSVIFISWGKPLGCLLILLSTVSEYLIGLGIGRTRENNRAAAAALLGLDIVIDLALMVLLGHNYLFAEGSALHIKDALIPLGAAWYATKGLSYCFDVFSGRCAAERNYFCLLTYMASYHFIMAGPVARYGELEPQIRRRQITGKKLSDGLDRLMIGLGKAVLLAPAFGRIATAGLEHKDTTLAGSWIGMAAFLAQYWFAFTGLCDIAKGLGLLGGFEYEDNYRDLSCGGMLEGLLKSANTSFVRLLGDIASGIVRGNAFFGAIAALICCVLAALWYHISPSFAAVGLALGAVVMIERLIPEDKKKKIPLAVKAVYVFLLAVVILGGLRFETLDGYKEWLLSLFGSGNEYTLTKALLKVLKEELFLIIFSFCYVCVPVRSLILKGMAMIDKGSAGGRAVLRVGRTVLTAAVFVMCVITLAAQKMA